jgi:hypothetical protein
MDYAQHNATYRGFLALVKGGIVAMALLVSSKLQPPSWRPSMWRTKRYLRSARAGEIDDAETDRKAG